MSTWGHVLTVTGPDENSPDDFVVFRLGNGRGQDIMLMTVDGKMKFATGYAPSQQAQAFMQAVNIAVRQAVFPLAVRIVCPACGGLGAVGYGTDTDPCPVCEALAEWESHQCG